MPRVPSRSSTLHVAVRARNDFDLSVVRDILRRGADPNALDSKGWAPLHYVVINPEAGPTVVRMFVDEYGANVDVRRRSDSATPLHVLLDHAPNASLEDVVLELIRCGADVNAKTVISDRQPLTNYIERADRHCNLEVIKELVKGGADVNSRSNYKHYTPLHIASFCSRRPDVFKELLKNGAEANSKDIYDRTPLHIVLVEYEKTEEVEDIISIIKELVNHGADVNMLNVDKDTPLTAYICRNELIKNPLRVVKTLLDLGADVNGEGSSPLSECLEMLYWNPSLIQELLQRGADTKKTADIGHTPLFQAVERYEVDRHPIVRECVELLIKYTLLDSEQCFQLISTRRIRKFMPGREFREYTSACFSELGNAKTMKIFDNTSLHTILTERSIRSITDHSSQVDLMAAVDRLLNILAQNKFPLFRDLLLSILTPERKILFDALKEKLISTETLGFNRDYFNGKEVTLDNDCVYQITKYLPDYDLLQLILAHLKSCISDSYV